MKYTLEPAFETSITHEGFLCDMTAADAKIVVIKFAGEPHHGTGSNFDAGYIIAMVQTILSGCLPNAVVIDFSKVNYEFGNGMMKALDLRDQYGAKYFPEDFPHAVVTNGSCNILYKIIKALGFVKNEFLHLKDALEFVEHAYIAIQAEQNGT